MASHRLTDMIAALRNHREPFTANEAHEIIAAVNGISISDGASIFTVLHVAGLITDIDTARTITPLFTDKTKKVFLPLFRASTTKEIRSRINDYATDIAAYDKIVSRMADCVVHWSADNNDKEAPCQKTNG